ncbi:MAG: CocE/NonD family hydrolase, partial [Phycisphaerae bacterium]
LWTSMAGKVQIGPFSVKREGEVLHRTIRDKTATLKLKPSTRLFENFTPPLISQAVRLYDRKKAGKQAFPLFILPLAVVQASLELIDTVERSVGGRDMTFHRYTYALPGVDMTVWADDEGRFYFGDVPAQHAAYVREGYESLRAAEESDPLLSRPTFAIKEQRGVSIPMRDGVNLSTDIFLPEGGGKFPVILVRTPYKKEMSELQGQYYARRGFAMAIQDCRGRFASGGTWEPFVHEPKDGYDTIEWLAKQPWSTGKVGMIGASYLGWVQWWAASQRPPHLVTIIPNVSPPDPFYNIPYEYGVFFMLGSIWWADILETEATADISGAAISKIGDKKYHKLLSALPVVELDKAVLGKVNPYWRKWIDHPSNDDYWQRASFLDRLKEVRIPVFHQSGWFDGDGIGAKLNYLRMASHGHPHQKLVLGPWGHTAQATRLIGERDFGSSAIIDLQRAYLRWFDHWLKGVDNGIDTEPLVSIFTMGSNQWLHGDVYPLPQTRFEKWYLASGGSANTAKGDGRLTREAPPPDAPPDRYSYNPGHPTPMPDFYEEPEDETEGKPDKDAPDKKASGKESSVERKRKRVREYHEKITSARSDILVYTSEPLKEPLTFAGPLSATLFAASSARDTDWFVRLMEVDEKGEFFPLAEGKIRARFRRSMRKPELLTPDKVEQYDLDLWQTGITIPAGRRLRGEVASASFPLFSRNLNTGGHNEKETRYVVAEQTIHHSARYPSHILLPVIPDAARTDATTNHR